MSHKQVVVESHCQPSPPTRTSSQRQSSNHQLPATVGVHLVAILATRRLVYWHIPLGNLCSSRRPRAATIISVLVLSTLRRSLVTVRLALELRPLAGLLVRTTLGEPSIVCVTITCRRLLFDSLPGSPHFPPSTFIRPNILLTPLPTLFPSP